MYEPFSYDLRAVIKLAATIAKQLNHCYLGTEHVLLALAEQDRGVAVDVLNALSIDLAVIPSIVERIVDEGPYPVGSGPAHTPRVKRVIEFAIQEKNNRDHDCVGTEHLLLGLLREGEGVAAHALAQFVELETIRNKVNDLMESPEYETRMESTNPPAGVSRGWLTSLLRPFR